ncbi:MAG: sulfur oxidation c-type cytochrome SoxA [Pseudomonadota bacterium]
MSLIRAAALGLLLGLAGCTDTPSPDPDPSTHGEAGTGWTALPADDLQSGYAFLQPDTQALQDDDFSNPGYLWVDRGAQLFATSEVGEPSCASCHGAGDAALAGVAARFPKVDPSSGALINLEGRINLCRERHQNRSALAYESEALLGLTAYVAEQSRGMSLAPDRSAPAMALAETGRDYFFTQRGQLNLSCHQCHDQSWGKRLRGDTISQGHGNAFPAYRLEWQSLGSLQRRLRDCDTGVRAEPLPYGDQVYVAVELYLAQRAAGLDIETPGVRR